MNCPACNDRDYYWGFSGHSCSNPRCVHFAQSARKNGFHVLEEFEKAQKMEKMPKKGVFSFKAGEHVLVDCGKFWGGEPHGVHLVEAVLGQEATELDGRSFFMFTLVREVVLSDGTKVGPNDTLSTYTDDILPIGVI